MNRSNTDRGRTMITIAGRELGSGGVAAFAGRGAARTRAGAEARPRSLLARVRRIFRRAAYPTPEQAFAARHRLWPAVEHACEAARSELGLVRVTMEVVEYPREPAYLAVDLFVPSDDVHRILEVEETLMPMIEDRFGERVRDRVLVTLRSAPVRDPS